MESHRDGRVNGRNRRAMVSPVGDGGLEIKAHRRLPVVGALGPNATLPLRGQVPSISSCSLGKLEIESIDMLTHIKIDAHHGSPAQTSAERAHNSLQPSFNLHAETALPPYDDAATSTLHTIRTTAAEASDLFEPGHNSFPVYDIRTPWTFDS